MGKASVVNCQESSEIVPMKSVGVLYCFRVTMPPAGAPLVPGPLEKLFSIWVDTAEAAEARKRFLCVPWRYHPRNLATRQTGT